MTMWLRIFSVIVAVGALMGTDAARTEVLELRSNRLFMPVSINGVKVEALLDSAAEMTFIDPTLAGGLGLKAEGGAIAKGSGGHSPVQFAKGVSIEAAGVQLTHLTVALLDMTDLSRRLLGSELRVVLGRELFDAARVEIDISRGTIRSLDAAVEPKGIKLPLTSHHGVESLPCRVEGVATMADLDLGNGSEVLIGKTFAEQHGLLDPGRVVERKFGGGIGGTVVRDIIVLESLEVAGVKFENVRAAIDATDGAGEINIGTSILRRFVLTVDYAERAVWLED
jgi:hypothetical protein